MPRKKKETTEPQEVEVVAPEEKVEVATEESEAKKQFRQSIEAYKQSNPVKYAQKEAKLLEQLNSL